MIQIIINHHINRLNCHQTFGNYIYKMNKMNRLSSTCIPLSFFVEEGFVVYTPGSRSIKIKSKVNAQALGSQQRNQRLIVQFSRILAQTSIQKTERQSKSQPHHLESSSKPKPNLLNRQNQLINKMIKDMIQSLIDFTDEAAFTTDQHKILFCTLSYFSLLIESKSTIPYTKTGGAHVHLSLLQKWIQNAENLSDPQNASYFGKKPNNNELEYLKILQLTESHNYIDLKTLLTELKDSFEQSQEEIRSLITFLIEIAYDRILWKQKNYEKMSYDEKFIPCQSHIQTFYTTFQNYKNGTNKKHQNLQQILLDCACLILGNISMLIGYGQVNIFKLLKLHLEFTDFINDCPLKNGEKIIDVEELIGEVVTQSVQHRITATQDYMLTLMNNMNFHDLYQTSIGLLQPYFSATLGIIAFLGNIVHPSIFKYDQEYRRNIIAELLAASTEYPASDKAINVEIFVNTITFYEKYLNPLIPLETDLIINDMNDNNMEEQLQIEDPFRDMKYFLIRRYITLPSKIKTNAENKGQIQNREFSYFMRLMKLAIDNHVFYLFENHFNDVLEYYIYSEPLSVRTLKLMVMELYICQRKEEQNHQNNKSINPQLHGYTNENQPGNQVDPEAYEFGYYFNTISINALQNGLINEKIMYKTFDYEVMEVIRIIQKQQNNLVDDLLPLSDPQAIDQLSSYFTLYTLLEQPALYFVEQFPVQPIGSMRMEIQKEDILEYIQNYEDFDYIRSLEQKTPSLFEESNQQQCRNKMIDFLNIQNNLIKAINHSKMSGHWDGYTEVLRISIKCLLMIKRFLEELDYKSDDCIEEVCGAIKREGFKLVDEMREYSRELRYSHPEDEMLKHILEIIY